MRFLLLSLISFILYLPVANAQEEDNPAYFNAIGLDVSFRSSKDFSSFSIAPTFLHRLSLHWSLGGRAGYSRFAFDFINVTSIPQPPPLPPINSIIERRSVRTEFEINAFVRYLINPEDRWRFFLEPSIGYARGKTRTETINSSIPVLNEFNRTFSLGISPGAIYQLHPRWRVLGRLGGLSYQIEDRKSGQNGTFENFDNSWVAEINMSSLRLALEFLF